MIKVVKLRQISIFIVNRINSLVSLDIENDLQVNYLKLYIAFINNCIFLTTMHCLFRKNFIFVILFQREVKNGFFEQERLLGRKTSL